MGQIISGLCLDDKKKLAVAPLAYQTKTNQISTYYLQTELVACVLAVVNLNYEEVQLLLYVI